MIISIVNISRGSATCLREADERSGSGRIATCPRLGGRWPPRALVTVVQTWGSAPRQAGAMLALRDDGRMVGSVSGGCIEDDLMRRARRRARGRSRAPDLRRHPRRGRALRPALRRHAAPDQRTAARYAMAGSRAGIDSRPSPDPAHGGPARWRQLGVARRSGRRPGFRRTHLSQRVRAALAAADHRRQPDRPGARQRGRHARFPRHGMRPARGVPRRLELVPGDPAHPHARRRGAGDRHGRTHRHRGRHP